MKNISSISDQILALQRENEQLQFLYKSFNKLCVHEFGYDIKALHKLITKAQLYEQKFASSEGISTPIEGEICAGDERQKQDT